MTSFERFESRLPALLEELAVPRLPDYGDDLFARTAAARQRAGWTFLERWFPMSAITRRLAVAPRVPWRLGGLVALLAIAAVVAALIAGSILNQRLAPFGPARNGAILLIDKAGAVVAADPSTGITQVVVSAAAAANTRPVFSPDGSKFFVIRPGEVSGQQNIFVEDLHGGETLVTPTPLQSWHYVGWSPRGDRILVRDEGGRVLLLDATHGADPVSLSQALNLGSLWIGAGFNDTPNDAFRPANGDEIVAVAEDHALVALRADGSGARTILDVQAGNLGVALEAPQWSPDGSQLVFGLQAEEDGPWATYLINADGSGLRLLSSLGNQYGPKWAPDGRDVAFELSTPPATGEDWVGHPLAIVDVDTGQLREVGPVSRDGYVSWAWSPDGASIIEVPNDGSGQVLIVNATTGRVTTTPWTTDGPISWQRLAPH